MKKLTNNQNGNNLFSDIQNQLPIAQFGAINLKFNKNDPIVGKIHKILDKYLYQFIYDRIVTNIQNKKDYSFCFFSYISLAESFWTDIILDKQQYRNLLPLNKKIKSYFIKDNQICDLFGESWYNQSEKFIAQAMTEKVPQIVHEILNESKRDSAMVYQYKEAENSREDDRDICILIEFGEENKYLLDNDLDINPVPTVTVSTSPTIEEEEPENAITKEEESSLVDEIVPELVQSMMSNIDENGTKTFKINMIDDETLKDWIDILNQNGYETSLKQSGLENHLTIEPKKESLFDKIGETKSTEELIPEYDMNKEDF